jgi:hypothetical protein
MKLRVSFGGVTTDINFSLAGRCEARHFAADVSILDNVNQPANTKYRQSKCRINHVLINLLVAVVYK